MDNAIDQMQKTAKSVMIFELHEFTPYMREMADKINAAQRSSKNPFRCCNRSAFMPRRIGEITEEISKLEGEAAELHDNGLKELYQRHRHSATRWATS